MLMISQISSASARHYLPTRAQAARWHGQAALRLGLHGAVMPGQLDALWEWGWRYDLPDLPFLPTATTPRPDKATPPPAGFIFGFSLPPTLAEPDDLNNPGFQEALQETASTVLETVEAASQTWFRDGRQLDRRSTGNLLWITPLQNKPRPGRTALPYVSCFVFNVTWDPLEARWKSLRLAAVKQRRTEYQQLFCDTLKERLEGHVNAG